MTAPAGAIRRWSWLAAAILPPAVVALLVALYAVDVPYWDTWEWLDRHYPPEASPVPALVRYWEPFNGHRVFVSLLLDRALFWMSGIDVLPRIALKLPLSLLTLSLILRLARATLPREPSVLTTGAIAALAFPLTYWPMWMDARQFSIHLVVLAFTAACVVAVGRGSPVTRSAVTGVLCLLASLSYGPGVLTWPFVFVLLLLQPSRPSRAVLIAWTAVGAVATTLQLVAAGGGTAFEPTAPAGWWATTHATAAIAGLPVAPTVVALGYRPTRVVGVLGVVLLLFLGARAWRLDRSARLMALPWLAIGGWGLSYAFAAALARGGLALASLHDPRFAYGSGVLWIGIVALLRLESQVPTSAGRDAATWRAPASATSEIAARPPRSCLPMRLSLVATCAIGLGPLVAGAWPFLSPGGISRFHDQLALGQACLSAARRSDDACLERLHPLPAHVRAIIVRLEKRGAAFLRPPQAGDPEADERGPVGQP